MSYALLDKRSVLSYFRQELNHRSTDIVMLIKQFRDICKMLDNPMYYKGDEIDVPIIQDFKIKIEKK